jgi:O-antigen ligase
MTFTLVLAVICAAGVLWEYQFGSNLFYGWSAKLLPGIFHVTAVNTTGYDEIGRRAVMGPADLSLEVVAMLSMALPIAFVRAMHSDQTRQRILYGLAVCILVGAMISTYRKSALLAPLSICAILAYFRRRELLRLAPLGVVILLAIPALAPNALGSILGQFKPGRLGAATVSDRVSDYDAVRPDLLSQLAFGRGFGSYEHTSHRILDNELLARVVETGVVGLIAFVMMIVLVIAIAAPIIRGRDAVLAPAALAIAAAAGAFLVLAVLFDVMSFPHTPYILMTLVGFLAVMVGAAKDERPSAVAPELGAEMQQRGLQATDEASSSAPVPV